MTLEEIKTFGNSCGLDIKTRDNGLFVTTKGTIRESTNESLLDRYVLYNSEEPNIKDKVFICEKIIINENGNLYNYHSNNTDNESAMSKIYPSYDINDDEAIKKAIYNLALSYKKCLNILKKNDIKKDFE